MDTLHAVHRRRRSCIMEKIYSHYNSYYVLLCRQEKDLAIDALLFRRHLGFIPFLSSAVFFFLHFLSRCVYKHAIISLLFSGQIKFYNRCFCYWHMNQILSLYCSNHLGIRHFTSSAHAKPPPPPPRLHYVSASHVGPSHSFAC